MNSPFTRPEKPGTYRVDPPIRELRTGTAFYAYWTGEHWCPARHNLAETQEPRYRKAVAHMQNKSWSEL